MKLNPEYQCREYNKLRCTKIPVHKQVTTKYNILFSKAHIEIMPCS